MSSTKCQCGEELTYDEDRRCYYCARCRPRKGAKGKPVPKKLDEARVRQIVQEEIEKAFDVEEVVETKTWKDKAKELGIPVYDTERKRPRKKVDVLAEIEEKLKSPETDKNDQSETTETE